MTLRSTKTLMTCNACQAECNCGMNEITMRLVEYIMIPCPFQRCKFIYLFRHICHIHCSHLNEIIPIINVALFWMINVFTFKGFEKDISNNELWYTVSSGYLKRSSHGDLVTQSPMGSPLPIWFDLSNVIIENYIKCWFCKRKCHQRDVAFLEWLVALETGEA